MLLLSSMDRTVLIALLVCFLACSCSIWSPETSFFSNFSVEQLVERNKSAGGLSCDAMSGGGGNGIGSRAGGLGSRGAHFNSHKSDNWACRLQANDAFDEGRLFSALKLDIERSLRDAGAQITQTGSTGPANFYFAYNVKNVRGRVELSGKRSGGGYYNVQADLEETGN
jgi:hypothetical protein